MINLCIKNIISLPKFGNSIKENEDSLSVPIQSEIEAEAKLRFAISDGATESFFSKEWADLLVSAYQNKSFDKKRLPETIKTISETWQSLTNIIGLPWYAQQKAEKGAFATFFGLTINRKKNSFDTVAIGDCTLFQIRDNTIIFSFPASSIEDFNNTPHLISSVNKYQTNLEKYTLYSNGTIRSNDIILLATDAMAAWILTQKDRPEKIRKSLIEQFERQDVKTFEEWLNKQRKANKIKNDDVTLLMIKFE